MSYRYNKKLSKSQLSDEMLELMQFALEAANAGTGGYCAIGHLSDTVVQLVYEDGRPTKVRVGRATESSEADMASGRFTSLPGVDTYVDEFPGEYVEDFPLEEV